MKFRVMMSSKSFRKNSFRILLNVFMDEFFVLVVVNVWVSIIMLFC